MSCHCDAAEAMPGVLRELERIERECGATRKEMRRLRERAETLLDDREEARAVAKTFYRWSLWLDREANAAFNACSIEELESLRVAGLEEYEKWRSVREGGKPGWLKK